MAEQEEARKVYRRQAEAAKRHTEEADVQSSIKKGTDTEVRTQDAFKRKAEERQTRRGRQEAVKSRVSDPDPYWIRIQSGQWIRICIRDPDPDPGGQK